MPYELVYTSAAVRPFSAADLADLLKVARVNNERAQVSGILLYHEGSFMQVLEGEQAQVRQVYEHVGRDKRHWRLSVLREGPIAQLGFAAWSMGFVTLDARLVSGLAGRHSLLSNGSLIDDHSEVLSLLDRFREGQWRQYVNG